jgi:hypothetical protein
VGPEIRSAWVVILILSVSWIGCSSLELKFVDVLKVNLYVTKNDSSHNYNFEYKAVVIIGSSTHLRYTGAAIINISMFSQEQTFYLTSVSASTTFLCANTTVTQRKENWSSCSPNYCGSPTQCGSPVPHSLLYRRKPAAVSNACKNWPWLALRHQSNLHSYHHPSNTLIRSSQWVLFIICMSAGYVTQQGKAVGPEVRDYTLCM